jgi:hypothetical protein
MERLAGGLQRAKIGAVNVSPRVPSVVPFTVARMPMHMVVNVAKDLHIAVNATGTASSQ